MAEYSAGKWGKFYVFTMRTGFRELYGLLHCSPMGKREVQTSK